MNLTNFSTSLLSTDPTMTLTSAQTALSQMKHAHDIYDKGGGVVDSRVLRGALQHMYHGQFNDDGSMKQVGLSPRKSSSFL